MNQTQRAVFPHWAFRSSSPQGMRVSLLTLRYSLRWRSRILLGVCSLTAITSPSLFKRHNESRAPSLSQHYPASSVLLAPPTSRPPDSDFGFPYTEPSRPSPATVEISRVTQCSFPHMPSRRPRRVHLLSVSVISTDGTGLPPLTTGSALSFYSHEALWVPWWYGLRVCDPPSRSFLDPLSPEGHPSKPDLR